MNKIRKKIKNTEESKNKLIMMLEDLLKYNTIEQKKEELVRKHGMKMTVSLERRLEKMCNLSENLIEKGEERGREAGIIALVKSLKSLDHSTEVILEQLMQNFDLSEEKAKSYL